MLNNDKIVYLPDNEYIIDDKIFIDIVDGDYNEKDKIKRKNISINGYLNLKMIIL